MALSAISGRNAAGEQSVSWITGIKWLPVTDANPIFAILTVFIISVLTVLSFVWSAGAVALAYKHQVGIPPRPQASHA